MLKNNKLIIIALLILSSATLYAQKPKVLHDATYDDRPLHFGFTLGLNTMDFTIKLNPKSKLVADVINIQPGFHVSMVADLRINDYFKLRTLPGLSFGERIVSFQSIKEGDEHLNTEMTLETSVIEVPVLLKYRAKRLNNYAPYVITGLNFRYDLAAKKEFPEDKEVYIRLNPFDVAYEAGVGVDFYLPYFKFTTELKMSNGILDILNHGPHEDHPEYVNAIDQLKSSFFMISFHFE